MSQFNGQTPPRDSGNGHGSNSNHQHNSESGQRASSVLDLLGPDDPLHQEMQQLLARQSEASSGAARQQPRPTHQGQTNANSGNGALGAQGNRAPGEATGATANLQAENNQLRTRVEELEQILEATTSQTESVWIEQQREYEALLEEKSEMIRALHQELKELREDGGSSGGNASSNPLQTRQELMAIKEQLEEERRQLQEDEEALMEQARQMEMAMSRERVELARQRNEIQQMYRDLQREIEQASRDGDLKDRLQELRRRRQDANGPAPTPAPTPRANAPAPRQTAQTQMAIDLDAEEQANKNNSGVFRRLFGG